jgi:hypothetical protein
MCSLMYGMVFTIVDRYVISWIYECVITGDVTYNDKPTCGARVARPLLAPRLHPSSHMDFRVTILRSLSGC